jgi:subtilisin family serine protease
LNLCLKILVIHFVALSLAKAENLELKSSLSSWALKQIETDKAQELSRGGRPVTVAVIDTGIDVKHPDLKNTLWTNLGESGTDSAGQDKYQLFRRRPRLQWVGGSGTPTGRNEPHSLRGRRRQ